MAAERLATAGCAVTVYERMPSPARKLLLAGRGGLNITHSVTGAPFLAAYGARGAEVAPWLAAFPPDAMVGWVEGLGVETFVGSSGRVFPRCMKSSPLVRAWLARLAGLGVTLQVRRRWVGYDGDGRPLVEGPDGMARTVTADVVVLAVGGASWPRLGADGTWVAPLAAAGVDVAPLEAANCGILIPWSGPLRDRYAGVPVKRIAVTVGEHRARGEAIVTARGLEGGAIYAVASHVRKAVAAHGTARVVIDLRPDETVDVLAARLTDRRRKQSLATLLRKAVRLDTAGLALMHEAGPVPTTPLGLAQRIKAVTLTATGVAGLERAISSAGGVRFGAVGPDLMLAARPGTFVAGEMLDWEAPTGGYLLQATFASAVVAADGALAWLQRGRDAARIAQM
jgi:hypothetical protein